MYREHFFKISVADCCKGNTKNFLNQLLGVPKNAPFTRAFSAVKHHGKVLIPIGDLDLHLGIFTQQWEIEVLQASRYEKREI